MFQNIQVITCVFGEIIDGKIKEKTYAKIAKFLITLYGRAPD